MKFIIRWPLDVEVEIEDEGDISRAKAVRLANHAMNKLYFDELVTVKHIKEDGTCQELVYRLRPKSISS